MVTKEFQLKRIEWRQGMRCNGKCLFLYFCCFCWLLEAKEGCGAAAAVQWCSDRGEVEGGKWAALGTEGGSRRAAVVAMDSLHNVGNGGRWGREGR